MRTREELAKIGKDMALGLVFTSNHIREADLSAMATIFMPLVFMKPEELKKLREEDKAYVFFEYNDKAGPRSINGYPSFFSFSFLTKEEWDIVFEIYNKATKALEDIQ